MSFMSLGGSHSDSDVKPQENGAPLAPHKDPNQIVPGGAKTGTHGGARPGAGNPNWKSGAKAGAVAIVPAKPALKVAAEDVRPFAELPFEVCAAVMDSDTFRLEEDQAQRHSVFLAAAVNDLGLQVEHAPVYAYVALVGATIAQMFAERRRENKKKAPVALEVKDAQPAT